jgi:methionine-rich copper-binding protein CopC
MADPVAPRERILTAPLLTFLTAVAVTLAVGAALRTPRPDASGAIALLADGDLDGDERAAVLRRLVDLVDADPRAPVPQLWAATMAAVLIEDRAAHARLSARVPDGPAAQVPAPLRAPLALGDAMLANLLHAELAARAGDPAATTLARRQFAAQARLRGHPFALTLANSW